MNVRKQGRNPGREEEKMALTALIVIFFIFIFLPACSPLFAYLCIFQLFLRRDPKD